MPTTAKGTPYPATTDTPDVPRDIQALAVNLDTRVPTKTQRGTTVVALAAASSGSTAIVFASAFVGVPIVTLTKRSGSTVAYPLIPQVTALTNAGMTITLAHAAGTNVTISPTVDWIAEET